MQADDYKFNVNVFVDGNEVSDKEVFYCDYRTALDAAIGIVDAEFNYEKNTYCRVWINLIAILYHPNGEIKDRWSEHEVYYKFIRDERPLKKYYLNDNWCLCYKKYGDRLIEGVVTELITDNRCIFKAFTHKTGTATFRKPEIVKRDKIIWQREGE